MANKLEDMCNTGATALRGVVLATIGSTALYAVAASYAKYMTDPNAIDVTSCPLVMAAGILSFNYGILLVIDGGIKMKEKINEWGTEYRQKKYKKEPK